MNNFTRPLLLASALVLPGLAAHAQAITPTVNPTGTASASATTRNTPGATVVGGVIYVGLTDYDTVARTPSVTDAAGNTFTKIEGPTAASDNNSHSWIFRAPVTHASGSAELVTATGTGTYNSIAVIYAQPPTGYTLGGVDCHNHGTAESGTLTVSCTTTQANDLIIGVGGYATSGAATGTTQLQNDNINSGAYSGYNQPSTSGSHGLGFSGVAAGSEMSMLAEKVTPTALTVTVTPSSFTPSSCPMASGASVATASSAGGDGNAVTWSLSGASADPSISINSTTGAITSNGSSTVCGNSYTTTVTGSQP